MQLGIIGLGRMGANMSKRLLRAGHQVVGWNLDPAPVAALEADGLGQRGSRSRHRTNERIDHQTDRECTRADATALYLAGGTTDHGRNIAMFH